MAHFHRFGRRMPVASTLAISHDLKVLWADEKARCFCAEADGLPNTASWDEIVVRRRELAVASERFRRRALQRPELNGGDDVQ